ncbi:MAG: hypothetical protein N5P05_000007 [Chroococcopsis gigantea SAG 12.99]|nr:hypothetical protein [Chroococcopsis gigantea SAG 12.99]
MIVSGHLSEPPAVAAYLQLCDIFLVPSLWDAFPNSLLEAMACSRFCLTSDAGGIPEIISHKINGVMLPPFQLHQLGEAILECMELDSVERQEITKAARNLILEQYTMENERVKLQTLLERLIPRLS